MVLVGNKVDLSDERGVEKEEGEQLATSWGCPFFETSSKTRLNVDEVFAASVRAIKKITGFDAKAVDAKVQAEVIKASAATDKGQAPAPAPAPPKPKRKCTLL